LISHEDDTVSAADLSPTGASFCDLCTAERPKTGTFHVQRSACTEHDVESIIAGAYEGPPAAFSHSLTVAAGRYPTKHSAADDSKSIIYYDTLNRRLQFCRTNVLSSATVTPSIRHIQKHS